MVGRMLSFTPTSFSTSIAICPRTKAPGWLVEHGGFLLGLGVCLWAINKPAAAPHDTQHAGWPVACIHTFMGGIFSVTAGGLDPYYGEGPAG